MRQSQAFALVALLEAAYGEFPEARRQVYVEHLGDLDFDLAHESVRSLVGTSKWLPTVAEIRVEARVLMPYDFGNQGQLRGSDVPQLPAEQPMTFAEWLAANPEWKRRLDRMLGRADTGAEAMPVPVKGDPTEPESGVTPDDA